MIRHYGVSLTVRVIHPCEILQKLGLVLLKNVVVRILEFSTLTFLHYSVVVVVSIKKKFYGILFTTRKMKLLNG